MQQEKNSLAVCTTYRKIYGTNRDGHCGYIFLGVMKNILFLESGVEARQLHFRAMKFRN